MHYGNLLINLIKSTALKSPGGGIGRRKGLKIPRGKPRAGLIPALGTTTRGGMSNNEDDLLTG